MSQTKLTLSEKELDLVTSSDFILTKNAVMQKAWLLLEGLQDELVDLVKSHPSILPAEVVKPNAKISRGENYKGLPYLILDYPRHFDKKNVCAIRCMFWWANFFSITLHLSGKYQLRYANTLISSYDTLQNGRSYLCIANDPWEHHFDITNYKEIKNIPPEDFSKMIRHLAFVKIANKIPLQDWNNASQKLKGYFLQFAKIIGVNRQGDEKGLLTDNPKAGFDQ